MSNSAKRKAAIIGAGLAGTTAGLGLVDAQPTFPMMWV
jgi:cation diffusion facilitator CzcD-associated flavoprotein CzcO